MKIEIFIRDDLTDDHIAKLLYEQLYTILENRRGVLDSLLRYIKRYVK
jgi:hypothetical protein